MKISPQFSEGNIISSANLGIPFVLVFPIHLFEQTFSSFNTQSFHEEKKKMKKKRERKSSFPNPKVSSCFSDLSLGYILSSKFQHQTEKDGKL